MGKVTGEVSRLTLSYDFVFLAAVRMALCSTDIDFDRIRCAAHISKERLVMKTNPDLEFTAAAAAILANAKVSDDIADERGLRRIKPALERPLTSCMEKRAAPRLDSNAAEVVRELLGKLTVLEKQNCTSADETSGAFGDVLGYIFSLGLDGDKKTLAAKIGRCIGKFVYICDAADDIVHDVKYSRYNPFAAGWGDMALSDGKISPLLAESITTSTPIVLEELGGAVEQLGGDCIMTPIIKNIVYLGLPASVGRVLLGKRDGGCRRRKDRDDLQI